MKNLIILAFILLGLLLTSCGEEEPDFVGIFELSEQQFQCPDKTISLPVGRHGFCVPDSDGESCLKWNYDIRLDGSYTESIISTTLFTGITLSKPSKSEGTYTTNGHIISMRSKSGTVTELMLDELETTLTGFVGAPSENGCRFYSTLTKI